MRLMLLFAVLTVVAVAGIEQTTSTIYVPMDHWECEPKVTILQTNNGPFYYRD